MASSCNKVCCTACIIIMQVCVHVDVSVRSRTCIFIYMASIYLELTKPNLKGIDKCNGGIHPRPVSNIIYTYIFSCKLNAHIIHQC